MQTLSIQIQDNYMQQFMNFVKESHSKITVSKDKNLELDTYFYERQEQLHQDLEDVESGKSEMVSHSDLWNNIHKHLKSK
ncbi:hypothetical protein JHD49_08695 [Sulfurimonas sp. SAG-AH-194-C21]|nr:hypothetical protein [Sulfurimonas sp. SAG-AH-194-C21]MDF1884014.1 hypothetical protein [Sulfurimonas sp. SAG-AH-194-C21]